MVELEEVRIGEFVEKTITRYCLEASTVQVVAALKSASSKTWRTLSEHALPTQNKVLPPSRKSLQAVPRSVCLLSWTRKLILLIALLIILIVILLIIIIILNNHINTTTNNDQNNEGPIDQDAPS